MLCSESQFMSSAVTVSLPFICLCAFLRRFARRPEHALSESTIDTCQAHVNVLVMRRSGGIRTPTVLFQRNCFTDSHDNAVFVSNP